MGAGQGFRTSPKGVDGWIRVQLFAPKLSWERFLLPLLNLWREQAELPDRVEPESSLTYPEKPLSGKEREAKIVDFFPAGL